MNKPYDEITYPIAPPEPGAWRQVAPGVLWLRLPLPYALDHINVWALDDGDGWALVDTGAHTAETTAIWERLAGSPPFDRPLTRMFVTHMHPDHIGLAGWFQQRHDARLWISQLEYLTCRALVSNTDGAAPTDALRFFLRAGWPQEALDGYRANAGSFGKYIHPLPDSFTRLADGQRLEIGGRTWEVVRGGGHSPEHVCLYCPALKLLISGDQVLPRISSNVSVNFMEPDADPMADWLASLDVLQARIPDDVLVLPSHNECFHGLHQRLGALRCSQAAARKRLLAHLDRPCRAVDVFPALFHRLIDLNGSSPMELLMATGEAVAHLNHLLQLGDLVRELDDGVAWYRRT